jgi:L-malate glycosyltransferase
MPRVLHLISQLEEGGAQRQLSYVARFSKKYEVEVASLIASPKDKLFPYFRDPHVPVHFLSRSSDFYAPEILPALRSLLSKKNYDLIHCRLYSAIVQGVFASRLENIPCVASPGSMFEVLHLLGNKKWERFLIVHALRNADCVLFPSFSAAVAFFDAGSVERDRVRTIWNGVDVEHFQPQDSGDALVAIGRIASEKAYADLDHIFQSLQNRFPKLRCLVAGGGTRKQSSSGIKFAGYVDDVREILSRARIFISTSKTEGMNNALLEAQAMGIPAVVRRIGSNSEVIENGVNGFLATTLDEFAEYCALLLQEQDVWAEMRAAARTRMEKEFSIQTQMQKMEALYDQLLGAKPPA